MCPFKTFVISLLALLTGYVILRPDTLNTTAPVATSRCWSSIWRSRIFRLATVVSLVFLHADLLLNLGFTSQLIRHCHTFFMVAVY
jgi:hypothetical protein